MKKDLDQLCEEAFKIGGVVLWTPEGGAEVRHAAAGSRPYAPTLTLVHGEMIRHDKFGEGQVIAVDAARAVVRFAPRRGGDRVLVHRKKGAA